MSDRTWTRGIALTAAAGGFALALVAAPLAPNGDLSGFTPNAALAKGGGNNGADNSGGRGGGNGNGHGQGGSAPGQVISNSAAGGEDGPGHGHGLALGHDKDAVSGVQGGGSVLHPENHGVISSMLGSLNAAHASNRAKEVQLQHMLDGKSPSTVGYIAAYEAAIAEANVLGSGAVGYDAAISDAVGNLLSAANKEVGTLEDAEAVVQEVNSLLDTGVVSTTEEGSTTTESVVAEGFLAGSLAGEIGGGAGSLD